eukprot:Nk52_evm57s1360 gene=Nk52_evmTU57s1360
MEVETSAGGEVFEINDFTNASPWEKFVSDIEDLLRTWQSATDVPLPSASSAVQLRNQQGLDGGGGDNDPQLALDASSMDFLEYNGKDVSTVRSAQLRYNDVKYKITLHCASACEYNVHFEENLASRDRKEKKEEGEEEEGGKEEERSGDKGKKSGSSSRSRTNRYLLGMTQEGEAAVAVGIDEFEDPYTVLKHLPPSQLQLLDEAEDFPGFGHPLQRWYGLRDFIEVTSLSAHGIGISEAKLLISSFMAAAQSTQCSIPVFVQLEQPWRKKYYGMSMSDRTWSVFDVIHMNRAPESLTYISGILELFKSKMNVPVMSSVGGSTGSFGREFNNDGGEESARVVVSTKFTYTSNEWDESDWKMVEDEAVGNTDGQDSAGSSSNKEKKAKRASRSGGGVPLLYRNLGVAEKRRLKMRPKLPCGPRNDPIERMQLSTLWPNIPEDTLIDNAVYSDLNPYMAPIWVLKLVPFEESPRCPLGEVLAWFVQEGIFSSDTAELMALAPMEAQSSQGHTTGIQKTERQFSSEAFDETREKYEDPEQLEEGRSRKDSTGVDIYEMRTNASPFKKVDADAIGRDGLRQLVKPDNRLISDSMGAFTSLVAASVQKTVTTVKSATSANSLPSNEEIMEIMGYLFSSSTYKTPPKGRPKSVFSECIDPQSVEKLRPIKGAPRNSILYNLVNYQALANYHSEGTAAVALLWHHFVRRCRKYWDSGRQIPGVYYGEGESLAKPDKTESISVQSAIDLNACLLYQKLQLFNLCVDARAKRQELKESANGGQRKSLTRGGSGSTPKRGSNSFDLSGSKKKTSGQTRSIEEEDVVEDEEVAEEGGEESGSDSDEFFDAQDNFAEEEQGKYDTEEESELAPVRQPEGVLEVSEDLCLLSDKKCRINIPITQDETPMTIDMVMEQEDVFANLGTSAEAASIRAKMQSASLLSDMQAFKAANPGCVIGDFVRWHSPRDWITGEDGKGELSSRMKQEGNIWIEMWNSAKAAPVLKQKPLFDFTKEAEKILHFMETISPCEFTREVLPILFEESYVTLRRQACWHRGEKMRSSAGLEGSGRSVNCQLIHEIEPCKVALDSLKLDIENFFARQPVIENKAGLNISNIHGEDENFPEYTNLIKSVAGVENMISYIKSYYHKLDGCENITSYIEDLLAGEDVKVVANADRVKIGRLCGFSGFDESEGVGSDLNRNIKPSVFADDPGDSDDDWGGDWGNNGDDGGSDNDFMETVKRNTKTAAMRRMQGSSESSSENGDNMSQRKPDAREFIVRSYCSRPFSSSRQLGQRMYCLLSEHEFRVSAAFSNSEN